jgi:hypothetical protein
MNPMFNIGTWGHRFGGTADKQQVSPLRACGAPVEMAIHQLISETKA